MERARSLGRVCSAMLVRDSDEFLGQNTKTDHWSLAYGWRYRCLIPVYHGKAWEARRDPDGIRQYSIGSPFAANPAQGSHLQ